MPVRDLMARITRRIAFLLGKGRAEREMNEEMRTHLEFEIEDRIKHGMQPSEARRTALVDFGGVERFKEEARVARGIRPIEDLAQDVSYAFRVLRKSPTFSITTVVTAAVGIAAITVVFSVFNAVLLRALPVHDPERLVVISEVWKNGMRSTQSNMSQHMYGYAHFLALRRESSGALSGMAGYRYGNVALREGNSSRPLSSLAVSANFFSVLGVRPLLGRLFSDTAEVTGATLGEVVIGYDFWLSEFRGDSSVVGRPLFVDGRAVTVAGIAPPGFRGVIVGLAADIWVPVNGGSVTMIGRLKSGVSMEQGRLALTAVARMLPANQPQYAITRMAFDAMTSVPAMSRSSVVGSLGVFMVMALLVLLIVSTNIAGMFFARAAYRRREFAVRLSLGASRARVVRQLLTETTMLSLAGGLLGVFVAYSLLRLMTTVELPVPFKIVLDFSMDRTVLALSFAVTVFTGLFAGLAPALQSVRPDLITGLRAVSGALPNRAGRARNTFVVAQLALSVVLLFSAGLFTRALYRASRVEPGMDVDKVVTGRIILPWREYNVERGREFFTQLSMRLAARPEIASSTLAEWTPLAFGRNSEDITRPDGAREAVTHGVADRNYLGTMRVPLVAGRTFSDLDSPNAVPVVIVNETLARRMWPGRNPIGQILRLYGDRQVVGVMKDGKYRDLDEAPLSYAFLPVAQRYSPQLTVHARARGDEAAALRAIREEVARLDPSIALQGATTMTDELEMHYLPQRFAAWTIGALGLFGLALSALGIYGVVAYQVVQRTREFGIRVALGARGADIVGSVLHPGFRLISIGILVGAPLAIAVARLARSYFYGISAADPLTLAAVLALFGVVVMLASYLPARRAARVDPMVSLRAD